MHKLITMFLLSLFLFTSVTAKKYGLSNTNYKRVLQESVNGGLLDYESKIVGDPNAAIIIEGAGTWFFQKEMAVVYWAMFVKKLGVENIEGAIALYKEIHGDEISKGKIRAIEFAYTNKKLQGNE